MKNSICKEYKHFWAFVFLLSLIIAASGCSAVSEEKITYTDLERENTYSGSDPNIFYVDTDDDVNLTYTLNLEGNTKDVFFVYTNTNTGRSVAPPVLLENSVDGRSIIDPVDEYVMPSEGAGKAGTAIRGTPESEKMRRDPYSMMEITNSRSTGSFEPVPLMSGIFYTGQTISQGTITTSDDPKLTVFDSTKGITLKIWVDENYWGTGDGQIDGPMLETLADLFLKEGADNDIYNWVTDIYGVPWGNHTNDYLIDTEASRTEIHILFYDIDNDGTSFTSSGGVVGYFYPKDNFKKAVYSGSNEKIMFYMDAPMFAYGSGLWQITDPWPAEIVSTLAHELQHMINFYQKAVMRTFPEGSETWLDEMCSLMAEDFISMKLDSSIKGPRGVEGSELSDGNAFNTSGRLPAYNYAHFMPVTDWSDPDDNSLVGYHYAVKYAFGAYLARNFGGAALFQKIVQCGYTDFRAVESALPIGVSDDFGTLLRKWGIAYILSHESDVPSDLRYNNGAGGFVDNALGYGLGSINLDNYLYTSSSVWNNGRRYFTATPDFNLFQGSSVIQRVGLNMTGVLTWTIRMRKDVGLTVVVLDY